jgi:hypothetical protein
VAIFSVSAFALLVVLLARNAYLFTSPVHEDSDLALNSLLVRRAVHFQLLVGNYSRVGFHHPGPAFLYVLAAGQAVFYGLLHLVPAPYNGQVLGDLFFTAAIVGWIVVIVERATRSRLAAAATLAIILLFTADHGMLADVWFPYLYVPVFALLLVSGAALAGGRTAELPAFVLAGGFLVHGHASFIMFVGVTALAAGVGWAVMWRHDWAEQLRAHRRRLRLSLGLVGLFMVPLVLQTVLHYPGPWSDYLHYVTQHDGGPGRVGDAMRFFSWYWSSAQMPIALTCLAALAGAVLLLTDRVPSRRAYFVGLYALLALESVLFAVYLTGSGDLLIPLNRYVGFFYLTVPLLLVVAAAAQLAARAREFGRLVPAVLATAVLVMFALGGTARRLHNPYRGFPYADAVSALERNGPRGGEPIGVQFPHDSWPVVAGVVLEASRRRVPICLVNPRWTNLFTAPYICQGQPPRWQVQILRGAEVPAGSPVVWKSSWMVITEQPRASGETAKGQGWGRAWLAI